MWKAENLPGNSNERNNQKHFPKMKSFFVSVARWKKEGKMCLGIIVIGWLGYDKTNLSFQTFWKLLDD